MSAKKTAKALDVVKTWREKSYFAVQLDSDDENSEIGLSIGRRIFGLGEGEDEYYALLSWTRNELNNLLAEDDLFGGMFIRDTERSVMKLHELMTDLRFAVYREYFLEYSIAGNMFRGDKGMMERFELDIKGNFRERYDVWLDSKWERINDLARFAGDILDAADKISEIRRYDFPKAKGFELEELKMELISALNFNRRICRDQLDLDHLDEQVLTLMISGEEMKGWDHYRMIWSGAMGKIKKRFKGMSRKDLAREDGNVVEGGLSAPLVFTGDLVGLGPEGTGSVLVFFRDMHFVPGREDEHSDTTQPVAVAPDFRIMNIVPGRGETSGGIGLFWDRTVPGEQNLTVTAETEGKHAGSFTSNVKLWKNMDKEDASFVALSTEWIKGYERGGAQHDGGLNRVISFVRNHCAYNGIKFIEGSDAFVAGEVKALKGRDKAASGVVLAGDECIALIEEAFVGELNLRKDERKKVLLGVIDNSQLEEESYVPLMPQLTLMIRLLRYQMKYPDYLEERKDRLREKFDKDGILGLDYDPERGVVKFKPAKVDVESLRPIYSAQVAA
jgi:hypothetical protein